MNTIVGILKTSREA